MDAVTNLFEGTATFFHPVSEGGPIGSCGPRENDESLIVALNTEQYGDTSRKSKWCFKDVLIKYENKFAVAKITDACPGCNKHSLDLTPAVFQKLADPDIGRIPITWCIIGEGNCKVPDSGDNGDDECT
ncbi:RlpA-like double-psi beta-barrel-protein domain-containing protein-containing protein [Dichotomocladium elegans]|nr:RlpA-like double-psi beta-barrel-protein domain-containing protein-containing protein [Dichotomocladium elegans]